MLRSTWLACTVGLVLLVSISASRLIATDARNAAPTTVTWSDNVRAEFTVPTDAELAAQRAAALGDLAALRSALAEIPDGAWISNQCRLEALEQQLNSAAPDGEILADVYYCLRHTYPREINAKIGNLRRSVDRLRGWMSLKDAGIDQQELNKQLEIIQARFGKPNEPLTGEQESALRYAFSWLAQWRRVDTQLAIASESLSLPNQVMTLSGNYMRSLASRKITHPVTINEMQDDAQISGQGDIEVTPAVELRPNAERGEVRIHVDGQGVVPLVAVSKPATVYASSQISFTGNQTLYLTPTGVATAEPLISADSNTSLCSVELSMRSRLVRRLLQRLVERVAARKLSESDIEAARRAQQEIQTEVVENSLVFATQLNDLMDRFFFTTLGTRDIDPQVRVRSTADELTWTAEYAARWQLGALSPAPVPSEPVGVLLQFHESAFNNASAAIAGVRLGEPSFQEVVYGMFRLQPPDDSWQKGARIAAVLHLADRDPLEIRFRDGRLTAIISIDAFEFGGKRVEGQYQIEATYEAQLSTAGITVERIGDTNVTPNDGADSELLRSAAARFFVPRVQAPLRMKPRREGSLTISHLRLENGWLSFGLSAAPRVEETSR